MPGLQSFHPRHLHKLSHPAEGASGTSLSDDNHALIAGAIPSYEHTTAECRRGLSKGHVGTGGISLMDAQQLAATRGLYYIYIQLRQIPSSRIDFSSCITTMSIRAQGQDLLAAVSQKKTARTARVSSWDHSGRQRVFKATLARTDRQARMKTLSSSSRGRASFWLISKGVSMH